MITFISSRECVFIKLSTKKMRNVSDIFFNNLCMIG